LQGLDEAQEYLVTLNPAAGLVRPERVLAEMTYGHPVYDARSVAAQRRLPGLNARALAYAGAYHGWGFHEDGCLAGVRAAAAVGGPGWPRPVRRAAPPRSGAARPGGRWATAAFCGWGPRAPCHGCRDACGRSPRSAPPTTWATRPRGSGRTWPLTCPAMAS